MSRVLWVDDSPATVRSILSNLFLHYTFDLWMARTHPLCKLHTLASCRY